MTSFVTPVRSAADQVRRERKALGWTQAGLADRCQRLGLKWDRSIVANFESGRRASLNVDELVTLAMVLTVPPIVLLFPLVDGRAVHLTDDVQVHPNEARQWFEGAASLPQGVWPFNPEMARRWRSSTAPLAAYREHDEELEQARRSLARWVRSPHDPHAREQFKRVAQHYADHCRDMLLDGLSPPPPDDDLAQQMHQAGVEQPSWTAAPRQSDGR